MNSLWFVFFNWVCFQLYHADYFICLFSCFNFVILKLSGKHGSYKNGTQNSVQQELGFFRLTLANDRFFQSLKLSDFPEKTEVFLTHVTILRPKQTDEIILRLTPRNFTFYREIFRTRRVEPILMRKRAFY